MFPNVSCPSSRLANRFARCECDWSALVGRRCDPDTGDDDDDGMGENEDVLLRVLEVSVLVFAYVPGRLMDGNEFCEGVEVLEKDGRGGTLDAGANGLLDPKLVG